MVGERPKGESRSRTESEAIVLEPAIVGMLSWFSLGRETSQERSRWRCDSDRVESEPGRETDRATSDETEVKRAGRCASCSTSWVGVGVGMKIVRVIARLNVGGPARHVAWLTAGLRLRGFETTLVCGTVPPGEDDMSDFARALGIEPVCIPEMSREISPRDLVSIWKLYRLLCRERPDIVHTHTAKAGTVGRIAGLFYRYLTPAALVGRPRSCKFVHTYHGHIFHGYYGPARTRLFLAIEKALARLATDRLVVISPQQRREIHERFGVGRAEQFAIVPLGLDLAPFDGWEKRRPAARAAMLDLFGAPSDALLIGIVGRLTEIKNHALFLRAAACYRAACDPEMRRRTRFIVIGDGHLRATLEAEARRLGLGAVVHFAGTRRDPENFYAALDLVALTSRNEGTPLTIIEALACERPVVATAVGGVGDLLGGAEDLQLCREAYKICERGVLVRPDDAEGFSRALARTISDETLRRELGRRGRLFVERQHSLERLFDDVARLYRDLARARPLP